ncbi:hypothetical protein JRO89_XS14G0108600 [Xanthoceras sorbifolium]|uniref:HMG box domain-containing protein n=1 Tax=Xanthoceras sorbifolium TaxID=99658 RepID=A0ABQ8H4Z4_9ROSI|nr:hypothetical protein JRO89_XS14G0108600 [Xanthoceras sorbifolium]
MKIAKGKSAVRKEKKEVLKPVEDRKVGKRKAALKASKSSNKRAKNVKPAKKDPNKPKRPPSAFFVFLEEFRKVYKQEHPNIKAVSAVGKAGGEKWKSLTDSVLHKTLHGGSHCIWLCTEHELDDFGNFDGMSKPRPVCCRLQEPYIYIYIYIYIWFCMEPEDFRLKMGWIYAPEISYVTPGNFQEKAPYEAKAAKRKQDYEKLMTAYNKKQDSDDEDDDDDDEPESERSKSEVHDDEEEGESGEEEDEDDEDDD